MNDELENSKGDKRKQHCTACRNHDQKERKTSHKCPYENCPCLLCELTQTSRTIMRHQQRIWRHLKDKNTSIENPSKKQVCDKCRNHGIMVSKRNHKGSCPHESCTCDLCVLTNNRRDIMRHQQRVRRSGTVTSTEHTEAYEYVQKTKKDLQQRFGDIDVTNGNDGYSSPEERDDTPLTPDENKSFGQDGTKKQFIERYRAEEIASQFLWEDDRKPAHLSMKHRKEEISSRVSWDDDRKPSHLTYQLQPEHSTLQSQASTSNWSDIDTASEGTTSKKFISQHVKEEIVYPVSSEITHDPPESSLRLSPQHHIYNPIPKRTRYGVPADDYQLSQSLPQHQMHPRIIPMGGMMCSLPNSQIGPRMSYPLNLLSIQRQARPFKLNYTHPFNKTEYPIIRPPYPPHS